MAHAFGYTGYPERRSKYNMKTTYLKMITLRSAALRMAVMAAALAAAFVLSGYTDVSVSESSDPGIAQLMEKRAAAMQRFMFSSEKDEERLFSELSDAETYPALSDDYSGALSSAQTDHDRVINIKLNDVECEARTRSYGIYTADVTWYMSGYTGYYTEAESYRIRTSIVNGRQYIAEIKAV